jgi:branched-chain amino acid transport system ATP-binding protein
MRSMLEVIDIHSYYGDSHILQGISMHVAKGSIAAVLGRNGVGKTTLLHSIISFVKPRQGAIRLDGHEITARPIHEIMRRGVALVPQGRRIFRSLNVAENLAVPFRCPSLSETTVKPWGETEVFETFPVLSRRRKQKAISLSGGEQQMLAIARALVSGPKLLLLDEPSEGLAPIVVREIAQVVSQLRYQGMAILLVEQNFNTALSVSDKVYVMSRGTLVHESSPEDLLNNEEVKAHYLGI